MPMGQISARTMFWPCCHLRGFIKRFRCVSLKKGSDCVHNWFHSSSDTCVHSKKPNQKTIPPLY